VELAAKARHISVCFVFISIPRKRCWTAVTNLFLSDTHTAHGIWGWHSDLMPLGSTTGMSPSYGEGCPPARVNHMHGNALKGRLFESNDKRWILSYRSVLYSCGIMQCHNTLKTDMPKVYRVFRDVVAKLRVRVLQFVWSKKFVVHFDIFIELQW
jgi:hypothetical protein